MHARYDSGVMLSSSDPTYTPCTLRKTRLDNLSILYGFNLSILFNPLRSESEINQSPSCSSRFFPSILLAFWYRYFSLYLGTYRDMFIWILGQAIVERFTELEMIVL